MRTPPTHYFLESSQQAAYMETHPKHMDTKSTALILVHTIVMIKIRAILDKVTIYHQVISLEPHK